MNQKRIFICGIATETHGFNKNPTTLEDFEGVTLFATAEDQELEDLAGTDHLFAPLVEKAAAESWDLVLGPCHFAWPKGPVTEHAFETLWQRIEQALRAEGPFDAIFMPLHGGMACEHLGDPEGEILKRTRAIVGCELPIAVTLDPHANLSTEFVRDCDIVCGFHTTPHVDWQETVARALDLLGRSLRGDIKPSCHSIHPPCIHGLDGGRTTVEHAPFSVLLRRLAELKASDEKLLDGSFFSSFPQADQPTLGPSAVIVVDGDNPRTDDYLDEFGDYIWETKDVWTIDIVTVEEALNAVEATGSDRRPFLLGDFSDCPYAGGYGDSTAMLSAFIERQIPGVVFCPLFDQQACQQAHEAGVGAEIEVSLGGKEDPHYGGGPVTGTARVKALSDGKFIHKGPYMHGQPGDLGESALLEIGGVDVIVTPFPTQVHDREQLKLFGLVAEEMNVICSKAFNHMRADFEAISRGLLYPDAGGLFSFDYAQFPYQNIRRPIWPLDDISASSAQMERC